METLVRGGIQSNKVFQIYIKCIKMSTDDVWSMKNCGKFILKTHNLTQNNNENVKSNKSMVIDF